MLQADNLGNRHDWREQLIQCRKSRQRMISMPVASAHVAIPNPPRYMNRLAKHFEHRVTVQRDERRASVSFPDAPCTMQASDTHLDIRIETTSTDALTRLQEVVTRHLKQVASQEKFEVQWLVEG